MAKSWMLRQYTLSRAALGQDSMISVQSYPDVNERRINQFHLNHTMPSLSWATRSWMSTGIWQHLFHVIAGNPPKSTEEEMQILNSHQWCSWFPDFGFCLVSVSVRLFTLPFKTHSTLVWKVADVIKPKSSPPPTNTWACCDHWRQWNYISTLSCHLSYS